MRMTGVMSFREIVTNEEKGLVEMLCKGVSETIAEIETRPVPAAFAELVERDPRNLNLRESYGLHGKVEPRQNRIHRHRVDPASQHHPALKQSCSGDSPFREIPRGDEDLPG